MYSYWFSTRCNTPETKAFEAVNAVTNGAEEIDMVMNIGALKSGDTELVQKDIEAVVNAVKDKALVKVIIETSLLTEDEKVRHVNYRYKQVPIMLKHQQVSQQVEPLWKTLN